ncbi:LamG-like jellyroll fold domain-containing protein [Amycolatopsis sp. GM8]|uniref:LamG-like jellyroll fold domain-containing protein n=1 Tax=Amycolatopsis sp. GM8 TaxID=2896530 RepID=UPI001F35306C|nr:LamG-like jellyroll fold domain-containing protein [Amycolatopsis sp. GM8]
MVAITSIGLATGTAQAVDPFNPAAPPPAPVVPDHRALPADQTPVSPPNVGQPPAAPAPAPPPPVSAPTASDIAKQTGKPVEVTAETAATRQVMANPDGSFTLTSNRVPVRAQKNGAWVPIDTTLHANLDGTLAPAATTENVTFSSGGTSPLVTLTNDTASLALSWPTTLPTPQVSGSTATYPGVMPGVDLQLTAEADSYSEVLVVHDATAAANSNLAHVHVSATATNLTLSTDANGALVATDPTGAVVFGGATPVMWDSAYDPHAGTQPTATNPGTGHVTTLPATTTNTATAKTSGTATTSTVDVSINPPSSALVGSGVTYPVYIDPSMSRGEEFWAEVTANGWYYINQTQWAQVGDCGSWNGCNGLTVARSYFQMGTEDISGHPNGRGARVFNAQLYANEAWSADGCTAQPVDVHLAGAIDGNTRWPGPEAGFINEQWSAAGTNCGGANNVVFDVTSAAQLAADQGWPNLTMDLRAPDEGNQYQWKEFADNPTLVINYSYPPNPAGGLAVSNAVTCTGHVYTSDAQPTLYATATDNNNPPLNPQLWYDLYNGAGTTGIVTSAGPVTIASGTTGAWTDTAPLSGNSDYEFRVNVSTQQGTPQEMWAGSYSPWYGFTRLAPPTQAPYINSQDYPANYWGQPSDNAQTVFFSANGASNVAGFTWTLTGAGTESAPSTSQCNYNQTFGTTGGYVAADSTGWANLTMPNGLGIGYHTIYVRSFDYAHNLSPESQPYTFYVAPPTGASGGWVEAETLPTSQPAGQNVPLGAQSNCCGVSWGGGAQLWFQGNAQGQSFSMTVNAPVAANYEFDAALTKAPDYGRLSFTLDGKSLGLPTTSPIDAYSATVTTKFQTLGGAYLTPGNHTLTITVVGTNSASTGNRYMAGIDGIFLKPGNQIDLESPQLVQATDTSGQNHTPVPEANDNGSGWRGGAQLLYPATAANQAENLTVTVPVEADYALGANLTTRSNYGQLEFTVDNTTVLAGTDTAPIDTYSATSSWTYRPFGSIHLTAGTHVITVTVTGKNASSSGFQAGIDYLTVAAINNMTAANFGAAMNNHGIAVGGAPANLDLWGGNSFSGPAMADAGYAPGSTVTISGATFTMPAANNGNDNILADGQTIPLLAGQQVKANAIGLLAASTCGASPAAGARITYTDGTNSLATVPSVPDWVYGDNTSATAVLSYIDNSTAARMSGRAGKFYTVFLPADPTKTVAKVTLPYTGTGQLTNTCNTGTPVTAALHVLAMAPRPASSGPVPTGAAGWLGAWAAPADTAAVPPGGAGFANQTIRMIVHPTTTGNKVRIRLSNAGAGLASPPQTVTTTVAVDAATIAAQAGTTGAGPTTLAAPTALTFGGSSSVTLPAGGEILSDPIAFPATSGGSGNLVVSIHLPNAVTRAPVHTGLVTPTYLASGNSTTDSSGTPYTTTLPGDYYLTALDATTTDPTAGTIAILGDQTSTAGAAGPGRSDQQTWVDDLPAALAGSLPGSVVNVSRAGQPAEDWWRLADGTGTTAADTAGTHPGTLSGGVTWSTAWAGDLAGSAVFDGTGAITSNGAAVSTARSFTISAWVNLTNTNNSQTVVAQDGTNTSSFRLEYDKADNRWAFTRASADTTNPTLTRALSTTAPQTGTWTLLTGVFDASNQNMTLYVNGNAQNTAATTTSPDVTGNLTIGRDKTNGNPSDYLTGSVSDVRVYHNTLTALDIPALYTAAPAQQPGPMPGAPNALELGNISDTGGALVGTSPDTTLNQTLLAEPNLRTVITTIGTNDVLTNTPPSTIENNLANTLKSSSPGGYALHNAYRPDGTPLHVIITTIPPLGLSTTDPRETLRVALNNDLRANYTQYGADELVDLDTAVANTTNPNQINPTYLTGNQPNNAYYQQLAQTLANAVNTFPPTATL